VLSAVTPATVNIVLRSESLCDGSTEAIASAADGLIAFQTKGATYQCAKQNGRRHTCQDQGNDWPAKLHYITCCNAQAKQRDANAKNIATRKTNAGGKALVLGEEVKRHPE